MRNANATAQQFAHCPAVDALDPLDLVAAARFDGERSSRVTATVAPTTASGHLAPRHHPRPQPRRRCQHPVVRHQMPTRSRHQGGSTFRADASGMPANSFVLGVFALAPVAIPIAALLPQGGPGCALLVSPDLIDILAPIAGGVTLQLTIPDVPILIGQSFACQVAPFDFSPTGTLLAITSSNALMVQIGAF